MCLLVAGSLCAGGQAKNGPPDSGSGTVAREPAVREIVDTGTGRRWLLMRDAAHPGGPGQLVEAGSISVPTAQRQLMLPVIHAGDRVMVEEHSERLDARLEAVALSAANAGDPVKVRLRIGGRVLQALAVAAGRAAFASNTGGGGAR